jgi:hypothetical protein
MRPIIGTKLILASTLVRLFVRGNVYQQQTTWRFSLFHPWKFNIISATGSWGVRSLICNREISLSSMCTTILTNYHLLHPLQCSSSWSPAMNPAKVRPCAIQSVSRNLGLRLAGVHQHPLHQRRIRHDSRASHNPLE